MTKEEIQEIYKNQILPESRNEKYKLVHIEQGIQAYNPLCGDKYKLKIDLNGDKIESIGFAGHGCALSQASTSLLAGFLSQKTKEEAIEWAQAFMDRMEGESNSEFHFPEILNSLISLKDFEGRTDCITLSWKAFLEAYDKH